MATSFPYTKQAAWRRAPALAKYGKKYFISSAGNKGARAHSQDGKPSGHHEADVNCPVASVRQPSRNNHVLKQGQVGQYDA